jgi:prepilin-type processing-associated H-X9-DG protein
MFGSRAEAFLVTRAPVPSLNIRGITMMPCRISRRRGPFLFLAAAILTGLLGYSGLPAQDQPAAPKEALPPDLQFVPADAAFFVSVRVADLWNSDPVKALREQKAQEIADGLKEFEKEVGVAPTDMERATVVMSDFKSRGPLAFITTIKPYDRAKILTTALPGAKAEKRMEQIFFVSDKKDQAVFFPSERTYLVGSAEAVRAYLERPAAHEGPLSSALELAAQKHMVAGGFNVAALTREEGDRLPPHMDAFKDLLKARSATWTVDLAEPGNGELRLNFANEAEAKRAEKPFRAAIDLVRAALAQGTPESGQPGGASIAAMLKRMDAALRSASLEQKGTHLQLALRIKTDATLVAELVDGIQKVRESANRASSTNNLKQLALAMHNYLDTYGHFPPQAIYSKDGKPLLSWRVLVLPYLEQDNLYRQFKLDEAWDGPHNQRLLAQMPKVFADPAVASKEPATVYQAFVGPGAFFEDKKGLPISEFTDGTSNTLMIVEAAKPVPWTKPQDLPYDPNQPLSKLGSHRPGGFNTAFCDGSVHFLKQNIKESLLRALITRNGGEVIDSNDFELERESKPMLDSMMGCSAMAAVHRLESIDRWKVGRIGNSRHVSAIKRIHGDAANGRCNSLRTILGFVTG